MDERLRYAGLQKRRAPPTVTGLPQVGESSTDRLDSEDNQFHIQRCSRVRVTSKKIKKIEYCAYSSLERRPRERGIPGKDSINKAEDKCYEKTDSIALPIVV